MRRFAAFLGLGATLLALAWFASLRPAPLPAPGPFRGELPAASPPPAMRVYRCDTGVTHRSAAFAYRGGSLFDPRDFAMTAVFVDHPKGGLLIDTGFGRDIDTQFQSLALHFRLATAYTATVPAADQLKSAGLDGRVSAILLTHAHWDHVSGVPDFPGTPVLVTADERRYVASGGSVMDLTRSLKDVNWREYSFGGGPYLGFPESRDWYGDGSVVIVPVPGHTPGSVIVFLATPDGKRRALVGDLVWQREGILEREERPFLQRRAADLDEEGVRHGILHMASIAARFPEMSIVPAHDQRGFADMNPLPGTARE